MFYITLTFNFSCGIIFEKLQRNNYENLEILVRTIKTRI